MSEEYFGNTVTEEEASKLSSLPENEAVKLADEIHVRNERRFPGLQERMPATPEEFFLALEAQQNFQKESPNNKFLSEYRRDHPEEFKTRE
jgi:hypothetical protein